MKAIIPKTGYDSKVKARHRIYEMRPTHETEEKERGQGKSPFSAHISSILALGSWFSCMQKKHRDGVGIHWCLGASGRGRRFFLLKKNITFDHKVDKLWHHAPLCFFFVFSLNERQQSIELLTAKRLLFFLSFRGKASAATVLLIVAVRWELNGVLGLYLLASLASSIYGWEVRGNQAWEGVIYNPLSFFTRSGWGGGGWPDNASA